MERLYVLYDGECALCRRCREWLGAQPAYVPLEFLPLQAPEVPCRFPGIERWGLAEQLTVVSDAGEVWQGAGAWTMCLWALRDYREWSLRLARRAVELVSQNRLSLSRLMEKS